MPPTKKSGGSTMMIRPEDNRARERATVAALVVVCALLLFALATAGNVWWQWQHCGTPLARCNPAEVVPCEPVAQIEGEWKELKKRAEN